MSKDADRVAAYGDVDELNAVLGWCRVAATDALSEQLGAVQNDLFVVGSELATPPDSKAVGRIPMVSSVDSHRLEGWIDAAVARVPALKHFVLPGGCELSARLHVARTCCRRAERAVVHLAARETVRREVVIYLNRLSDLLFAWARQANTDDNVEDTVWIAPK